MRYQKIESRIWNDEKFIQLSPNQQRLFFYILTCPHGNLTGMFVLKEGYVCDDLKLLPKDFQKDLTKIVDLGLVMYDPKVQVVVIKNFLKHNPITNPNQTAAAIKILYQLPKTSLIQHVISACQSLSERVAEELTKGLKEVLAKPETETEPEPETETETETILSGKPDCVKGNGRVPYETILLSMNSILNKRYKNTTEFKRLVKARWDDGFREGDFAKVCEIMRGKWGRDPKMQQYLRPITLFSPKMDSYLNQTVTLSDRGIISEQLEKSLPVFEEFASEIRAMREKGENNVE